ncbi:MAG TPA: hypothetical protein VKF81_15910 [Blastocatellia bacterium]|nr:hypothetical protein [Blastocatellia bacterium]
MTLKQATFEEIVESERELILTADQRYGKYYLHARECAILLSRCIISVDPDRMMFARFFSLIKKQVMLALLSTLRLHKVQALMNLRQVLEAGAAAAFAIANPEPEHFARTDANGFIDASQDLTEKRYKWLAKHFPAGSEAIKKKKNLINDFAAHANVVATNQTFEVNEVGNEISAPFFDTEDEYHVKTDLWQTASISIELMGLLYEVNKTQNVLEFIPNFEHHLRRVYDDNSALLMEMKSTKRYKAIERMQKASK